MGPAAVMILCNCNASSEGSNPAAGLKRRCALAPCQTEERGKGHVRTTEQPVQPSTHPCDRQQFGGDRGQQAPGGAGTHRRQAQDLFQLAIDRLHDLPSALVLPLTGRGRCPHIVLTGKHLGVVVQGPVRRPVCARKAPVAQEGYRAERRGLCRRRAKTSPRSLSDYSSWLRVPYASFGFGPEA